MDSRFASALAVLLVITSALLVPGCGNDTDPIGPKDAEPPTQSLLPTHPDSVAARLETALAVFEPSRAEVLLHEDFTFEFSADDAHDLGLFGRTWSRVDEMRAIRDMADPREDASLHVTAIDVFRLDRTTDWTEDAGSQTADFEIDLDATTGRGPVTIRGTWRISVHHVTVVEGDREESGWQILRWTDLGDSSDSTLDAGRAGAAVTWGRFKADFSAHVPAVPPSTTASLLVQALEYAWEHQRLDVYDEILAEDFVFVLSAVDRLDFGVDSWDRAEELDIARQIFGGPDREPSLEVLSIEFLRFDVVRLFTPEIRSPEFAHADQVGTFAIEARFELSGGTVNVRGEQELYLREIPEDDTGLGAPRFELVGWADLGIAGFARGRGGDSESWGSFKARF